MDVSHHGGASPKCASMAKDKPDLPELEDKNHPLVAKQGDSLLRAKRQGSDSLNATFVTTDGDMCAREGHLCAPGLLRKLLMWTDTFPQVLRGRGNL